MIETKDIILLLEAYENKYCFIYDADDNYDKLIKAKLLEKFGESVSLTDKGKALAGVIINFVGLYANNLD